MCNNTIVKELLAPYQEQRLEKPEQHLVETHLASCEDCRLELSLISLMSEERVPEPGDAFWEAMPGRVYRVVQEQQQVIKASRIGWFLDRITLPRWAFVSATTAMVLLFTWFLVRPVPEMITSQEYEFADETLSGSPVEVAGLSGDELMTLDTWAGSALASIANDIEQAVGSVPDNDMYEDVAELNAGEAEQLLKIIDQRTKEVSS